MSWRWGQKKFRAHRYKPVEINLAVDLAIPRETFLIEDVAAVHTADTVGVPGLLQHGQDVLVKDGLLALAADHQHRVVQEGHRQRLLDLWFHLVKMLVKD